MFFKSFILVAGPQNVNKIKFVTNLYIHVLNFGGARFFVQVDTISTGKIPQNTKPCLVFSLGVFPVRITSFIILSQHKGIQAIFSLFQYIYIYIYCMTLGLLAEPCFNSGRLCQDAECIQWWLTITSDIDVRTMNLIDNLKDETINPFLIDILLSTSRTQSSTKSRQLRHWSFYTLGTAWKLHKCQLGGAFFLRSFSGSPYLDLMFQWRKLYIVEFLMKMLKTKFLE